MSNDDHKRLASQILSLQGMCVLSGYQTPLYEPLEQAGWKRIEIETFASTSKNRAMRVECLWISPNCYKNKKIHTYSDIDGNYQLTNRQKAALKVHRYRKELSEKAISESIYSLKRMKKKVTKVVVSRMTGISREHITRIYQEYFQGR